MKPQKKPTPNCPISWASAFWSPESRFMNSRVPLLAMVPRLSIASCWDRPMPLSVIVRVRAALSKATRTSRLGAFSYSPVLFKASKRSLSHASEALEISSRRKISLFEYSEWVTRYSSCATSAWKESVCFWLMEGILPKRKTPLGRGVVCFGAQRLHVADFPVGGLTQPNRFGGFCAHQLRVQGGIHR